MNSASSILTLLTTPPTDPASSPLERLYFAPLTIGISPSVVTFVGPLEVSEDLAMLG